MQAAIDGRNTYYRHTAINNTPGAPFTNMD